MLHSCDQPRESPASTQGMTNATTHTTAACPVSPNALRVRRHRERRRYGLRMLNVTVPETVIASAVARGLLASDDGAQPWSVIQGCYASLLSDAALAWLIDNGVITHEQRGDAGIILRSINGWLERSA
jgi:hypothetical protein